MASLLKMDGHCLKTFWGRQHDGALFVALPDNPEEQVRLAMVDRQVVLDLVSGPSVSAFRIDQLAKLAGPSGPLIIFSLMRES